jgi:hypothetical protein
VRIEEPPVDRFDESKSFTWYWCSDQWILLEEHALAIFVIITLSQVVERESVMVFNATFNNISVISWRSVLLVVKGRENHRPVAIHWWT